MHIQCQLSRSLFLSLVTVLQPAKGHVSDCSQLVRWHVSVLLLCSCSASLHSASHCISFFSHCQWQKMWKNPFSLLIFFDLHLLNSAVISCGKIVELSLMCFFLFILLDFFVVSKDSQLLNVLWNISNIELLE